MLYLLDASVLITANNLYYAVDRVPEFWAWLQHHGNAGNIRMPAEIFDEIKPGPKDGQRDLLHAWFQNQANHDALLLAEDVDLNLVRAAVTHGYAADLTDVEVEQIGRDPFLIAYALAQPKDRCIVTAEVSAPKKQRQNRKIPDVCKSFGLRSCDIFALSKALGFSTAWNKK
jgi:Domain of unknown function (DUF4411)